MKRILLALGIVGAPFLLWAGSNVRYDGPMTDGNAAIGLPYNKNYTMNLDDKGIDYASVQVIFSSGSYANNSFTDGRASTMSLTVASFAALSTHTASGQATVVSTQGLVGASVYLGGYTVYEGKDWTSGTNTGTTACSIASALNTVATVYTSSCVFASSLVQSTSPVGAIYNRYSIESSSPAAFTRGVLSGGQDNATFTINGNVFKANQTGTFGFYPITSNAVTAAAIASTIAVAGIGVTASATAGGVVFATTTAVGANTTYATATSTQAALTLSPYTSSSSVTGATGNMYGGLNSSFTLRGQNVTVANHGWPLGLGVYLSTTSGTTQLFYSTAATGGTSVMLGQGTTFYVIPLDANTIQLATTSFNAQQGSGSGLYFASSSTLTSADTYSLIVPSSTGTVSVSWGFYVGNDATQLLQIPTVSTYTASAYVYPSTSAYFDLGNINWKFLQMNVVSQNSGAGKIKALLHGEAR